MADILGAALSCNGGWLHPHMRQPNLDLKGQIAKFDVWHGSVTMWLQFYMRNYYCFPYHLLKLIF